MNQPAFNQSLGPSVGGMAYSFKGSNAGQHIMNQTIPKAPVREMFSVQAKTSSISPKKYAPDSLYGSLPQQTRVKPQRPMEFNYDHDFDENGVFYYLGTYGKKRPW